jgi:hypothetical protein
VRGTGRLLAGDPRGALAEAAGGLLAPLGQVYREAGKLAAAVFEAATALTADEEALPTLPVGVLEHVPQYDAVAA